MKNKLLVCFVLSAISFKGITQVSDTEIAGLKAMFNKAKADSTKLFLAIRLAEGYRFSNVDSSFVYNDLAIGLATKLNLPGAKGYMLSLKGSTLLESGKLPEAMQLQFEAIKIAEKVKDTVTIGYALNGVGNIYMELGDYPESKDYYNRSMELFDRIGFSGMYYNEVSNIGNIYDLMGHYDSALYYQQKVYAAYLTTSDRANFTVPEMMFRMGNVYKGKGNNIEALNYYKKGVAAAYTDNDLRDLSMNTLLIAKLYKEMDQPDSSRKYAFNSLETSKLISFKKGIYEASIIISELFKNNNQYDSAYKYMVKANVEKESLTGTKRFQELQHIALNELEHQRKTEAARIAERNKQFQYALITGLALVLIVAFILYSNNKQKQKAHLLLEKQKKKVETALNELKSMQSQLIQSEKMASLGELTAGIAHEIQNPLNFVNNFSELNKELVGELKAEIEKGNTEEAITIAGDLESNSEKIRHHGKRADAIVKGMLQHSRSSSGVKEPIDINVLADEYLRLSYHGLRAKDKSFNAEFKTSFDNSIGKIDVIPQDMGRVLLNLFNNAFYAVGERKKQFDETYKPIIEVSTERKGDKVTVHVKDNGTGIPLRVIDKIYQPFFTTKPTGEGTGLGLSLSYDIVTKGHNGEMNVTSKEGEGTEFTIALPI